MPTAIALLNGNAAPARARLAWLALAIGADARARRRRRRGVSARPPRSTRHRNKAPRGSAAAVLQARLEPVELRRWRRHIGVGLPRGAVGLGRGAAEIVGIGGDVAEAAHAGAGGPPLSGHSASRPGAADASRTGGSCGSCIETGGCGRGAAAVAAWRRRSARGLRGAPAGHGRCWLRGRSSCPSGGRSLREGGGGGAEGAAAGAGWRRGLARRGGFGRPRALARRRHRRRGRAAPPPLAREASRARWAASDSTLRTASSSDSRSRVISNFGQRRLHAAQLGDQRGARPLVERTTALAGGTGVQSGDGAGDQRVVVGHLNSTMRAFQ